MQPTTPSVLDLRTLPDALKNILGDAMHSDDDGIFDAWVQLCRAIAFLGPSADRYGPAVARALTTAARAAEMVVIIHDHPGDLPLSRST